MPIGYYLPGITPAAFAALTRAERAILDQALADWFERLDEVGALRR